MSTSEFFRPFSPLKLQLTKLERNTKTWIFSSMGLRACNRKLFPFFPFIFSLPSYMFTHTINTFSKSLLMYICFCVVSWIANCWNGAKLHGRRVGTQTVDKLGWRRIYYEPCPCSICSRSHGRKDTDQFQGSFPVPMDKILVQPGGKGLIWGRGQRRSSSFRRHRTEQPLQICSSTPPCRSQKGSSKGISVSPKDQTSLTDTFDYTWTHFIQSQPFSLYGP